jgi:type IV pilus assembly protein PilB
MPEKNPDAIEEGLDAFFGQFDDGGKKTADAEQATISAKKNTLRSERVLSDMLRTLLSKKELTETDMRSVIGITIQKFVEAVQAQAITVFFLKEDGKIHFEHVFYSPSLYRDNNALRDAYKENIEKLKKMKLEPGQGIVGMVIKTGEPYISHNAKKDPNHTNVVDKSTGFETLTSITVPIKIENDTIGAIQALNKNPLSGAAFFENRELMLLVEIADYSSRLLAKVRNPKYQISDVEMAKYIARLTKCEYFEIGDDFEPDEKLFTLIGEENIKKFQIIPIRKLGTKSIKAAMTNPLAIQKRDSFELATELHIEIAVVSTESAIEKVIKKVYKPQAAAMSNLSKELSEEYKPAEQIQVDIKGGEEEKDAPVIVKLASQIIEDAYSRGTSDIHLEPHELGLRVRYRIDGLLQEVLELPRAALGPLISRLKIMCNLDISEKRLPQDGRIKFKEFTKTGIDIDLRVSTAPMIWGEKIVMRILDMSTTTLALKDMGLSDHNLEKYNKAINAPYGMILHVGPTGSGKSTALYAALNTINTPDINIQTAEDPVEYQLKGINQCQMKKEIGLTFARALRAYLRQDPDVILVGEIRDLETAEIAIEAALTGHLLLSTLHTNDAAGTIMRFVEMGIEPFMVSSSLLIVCAQRLMRRLCKKCKQPYAPTQREVDILAKAAPNFPKDGKLTLMKTKGCQACGGKGYKGRIGTYETLSPDDDIKQLVNKKSPSEVIKQCAMDHGMITLYRDALSRVVDGTTTLEEALSTVRED